MRKFTILLVLLWAVPLSANAEKLNCSFEQRREDWLHGVDAVIEVHEKRVVSLALFSYSAAPRGMVGSSCDMGTSEPDSKPIWTVEGRQTILSVATGDSRAEFLIEGNGGKFTITPGNGAERFCTPGGKWPKKVILAEGKVKCHVTN